MVSINTKRMFILTSRLSNTNMQLIVIIICICILFITGTHIFDAEYFCIDITRNFKESKNRSDNLFNAFILTASCTGERFKKTSENLQRAFPDFFHIRCFQSISLNDSRIHTSNDTLLKIFSSVLISTIEIWTYEIPKYASQELEWSFFFEDDINVVNPETAAPIISMWLNYTQLLEELMEDDYVRKHDGMFYLGICGPEFDIMDRPLHVNLFSNESIFHYRGYGLCGHALAFTTKRARTFWAELSSYRPAIHESGVDRYVREFCLRTGSRYYTFGANKQWPSPEEHYGLVYQDRGVFRSTVHEA